MTFRILALPRAAFAHLFRLDEAALAARGARRQVVEAHPGTPCRVSLADAEVGETVILCNHMHQSAASPYRGTHAIFVRDMPQARPSRGEVPHVISSRLISLRAFDRGGMMRAANVVGGADVAAGITRMLNDGDVTEVHIHNAKPGCYAARAVRA